MPSRPVGVHLAAGEVRQTCAGPSDTFGFRAAGRVLQIEINLGPDISPALRGRVAGMRQLARGAHCLTDSHPGYCVGFRLTGALGGHPTQSVRAPATGLL
jgi:hypothetical protein